MIAISRVSSSRRHSGRRVVAVGRGRRARASGVVALMTASLASIELAGLSVGEDAVEDDRAEDQGADDGALPEVLDAEDRAAPG